MKTRMIMMLLATSLSATVLAQDSKQLTVGDVTMTVYPQQGAKIMSLTYKGKEIISQSKRPEAFGSTFWTSPQKEWYWPPVPEFDKQPYTLEERDGKIIMTSPVSARLKYRVRKEFSTDAKNKAIVITYSIINESDETRQVAPWEITRVTNADGLIFFEAPVDSIWPQRLMTFEAADGAAWYKTDEAQQNRKVNADGAGWLAYMADGLLLVKKFLDLKPADPAPGEAEIQVYVNRGKSYIELESQGAYTLLRPGERLTWTVRWFLLPAPSSDKLQLLKVVRSL